MQSENAPDNMLWGQKSSRKTMGIITKGKQEVARARYADYGE